MAKRNKIAHEILDSERRYVDSLLLLQQTFLDPLMAVVGTDAEILPKRVIQCIFSELAGIVNVNTELKRQLEDRIENVSWDPGHGRVGDIFLNMAPFLKMYSSYVKNFNSALSTVEDLTAKVPAFADFVAKKNKVCHGLNLQSYLILPVQRIPRYKLLLEDLMKHTDVEHPDQPTLKQSLNRISEVAVFVNETIREHEMMQSLIDVQRSLRGLREDLVSPGRRLIHKGTVQKICRKRHQTRHLILLSDYLIYSSPGLLEDQYIFHRKLDLELCEVIDVPDTQDLRHIFQIVSPEKSFAMYTDEAEEKQKWIQAIRRTVRELRSNRSTLRNEGDRLTARERKKKLHNYSAPVWVPDDAAHSCMVCSQEFSVLKRKHHCRACGKVVCHICSSRYFIIPGLEKDHPARACNPCYERISQEGKLQVVPTDATSPPTSPVSPNSPSSPISLTSSAPLASPPLPSTSPADDTSTRPRPRPSGARRVRPVSMAPQLWSMLGKNFIEHTGPLSPTSSTRPRAPSEVSSSAGVRECSLCRDTFSLMKWKYLCAKCGRSMCSDCASKKSQMQLCDPCYHGLSPLNIIVDERGGGWSAPCVDDDIDERKDVASEVIVPACN
ncbi:Dbl homology domain-containing protein [Gaertneriomyces semiglobifer]|nr:Dbl homology domain-containing protein [Gaertneriomyces semiglobifer]